MALIDNFLHLLQFGGDADPLCTSQLLRYPSAAVAATGGRQSDRLLGLVRWVRWVRWARWLLRHRVPDQRTQLLLLRRLPPPTARWLQHGLLRPRGRWRFLLMNEFKLIQLTLVWIEFHSSQRDHCSLCTFPFFFNQMHGSVVGVTTPAE